MAVATTRNIVGSCVAWLLGMVVCSAPQLAFGLDFEKVAADAQAVEELGEIGEILFDPCTAGNEFEIRRCKLSRSRLQTEIRKPTWTMDLSAHNLVEISKYDFARKGFFIRVSGIRLQYKGHWISTSPMLPGRGFPKIKLSSWFVRISDQELAEAWANENRDFAHLRVEWAFKIGSPWKSNYVAGRYRAPGMRRPITVMRTVDGVAVRTVAIRVVNVRTGKDLRTSHIDSNGTPEEYAEQPEEGEEGGSDPEADGQIAEPWVGEGADAGVGHGHSEPGPAVAPPSERTPTARPAAEKEAQGAAAPGKARFEFGGTQSVVFDTVSRLSWQRAVPDAEYTWLEAKDYCKVLDLDGGGWRLPTHNELSGIVDLSRANPAIDTVAFPWTPSETFWTSTPYAEHAETAWYVDFRRGAASGFRVDSTNRVRCAR